MLKFYWFALFGILFSTQQFSVFGIDLSRLYGHENIQKRGEFFLLGILNDRGKHFGDIWVLVHNGGLEVGHILENRCAGGTQF
jgi:hypothetical protein